MSTKSEIEAEIARLSARIVRHLRSAVVVAASEMEGSDNHVIAFLTEIVKFAEQRRILREKSAK